ncbi:MAG: capsule biosynthesis protein [Burkholderiales bacterium]
MSARSFLFLQGCTSFFFGRLADRLRSRGHAVSRINFNAGDAVYWGARPAWNFRDGLAALPEFMAEKFRAGNITDVVMLGDTRPVHVPALAIAARCGVRVHVYEEGYFRPSWLTLERGGINGYTRLPRDPAWYRTAATRLPEAGAGVHVPNPVSLLAWHEACYHLPNLANPLLYPGYRTHRPQVSAVEFAGWGRRFAVLPLHQRRDAACIARLAGGREPFYVFPLQLDSDSQIAVHSPFDRISDALWQVVQSFAQHAPGDTRLVIKNHPLDTGFGHFGRRVRRLAGHFHIAGRVDYLETGHLPALLEHARGMVTINSTAGTAALALGCPTLALGKAVYDLPGLTFQGPLDAFWREASPPDAALFRAFRNVVMYTTQVNGGFYTRQGMELAVENSMRLLEPERSLLEELT